MKTYIYKTKKELGRESASAAAEKIRSAIGDKGEASIILATGASQFETLDHLVRAEGIDWSAVTMFHLDEYLNLSIEHPASFRNYLQKRFVDRIPDLKAVHFIDGEAENPALECRRLADEIERSPVDVALVGIGENGHLAFNDPPADFETDEPFIVVRLDEVCRRQQMGEGWFDSLEDVPEHAITMSIRQILKAQSIICSVPDKRKAEAVRATLEEKISPMIPASILREHPDCNLYLDEPAASLLEEAG